MRSDLLDRITTLKAPELATAIARAPALPSDPLERQTAQTRLLDPVVALGALLASSACRDRHGHARAAELTMINRARFREPVEPGTELVVEAHGVALATDAARVRGELHVGKRLVAEVELTFRLVEVQDDELRAGLERELERLTNGVGHS